MRSSRVGFLAMAIAMLLVSSIAVSPSSASGDEATQNKPKRPYSPDRIIVKYKDSASAIATRQVRQRLASPKHEKLGNHKSDADLIYLPVGASVADAIVQAKADPAVEYAGPDYLLTKADVPNDECYSTDCVIGDNTLKQLWGMQGDSSPAATNEFGSQAAEVWQDGYTGSREVVIGVIDEGIQYLHPDLSANIWTNPNEIPGNNVDDDGNGLKDDIHGWDFYQNNSSIYDENLAIGQDAHGTHVAGTIGAVGGNGQGVAGVNWKVSIIGAKFLGSLGGTESGAIRAIHYLVDLKVNHDVNIVAINNSWGGGGLSKVMRDAINAAGDADILFVAAAGNDGRDNDEASYYPANYECGTTAYDQPRGWDCLISVAALDSTGTLAPWSNYGQFKVDIAAPGAGITSTLPKNTYGMLSGTSMATPHVTGAIALCASLNPNNSASTIREILFNAATPTTSVTNQVFTNGRLNIAAMQEACTNTFAITNSVRKKEGNQTFTLAAGGGTGSGAISFEVIGDSCSLGSDGVTLSSAIAGNSCQVIAHRAASGSASAKESAPEVFTFTKLQQPTPVVVSSEVTAALAGTQILLEATGGDGPIATYTYRVTGSNCALSSWTGVTYVVSNRPTTCSVRATRLASGDYVEAVSDWVDFTMTAVEQAPLYMTNQVTSVQIPSTISLTSSGGSGSGSITYRLAQPNEFCKLSGPSQSLLNATKATACAVFVQKAGASIYGQTQSAAKQFIFQQAEISSNDFPSTQSSVKRGKVIKISAKTSTGRKVIVRASGKCSVKKKYVSFSGVKSLVSYQVKAKATKGTCTLKLYTTTESGQRVGPEVRKIRVR